jgi:hypothetical protein
MLRSFIVCLLVPYFVSLLRLYLQTIYPHQWRNFLQRIGLPPDSDIESIRRANKVALIYSAFIWFQSLCVLRCWTFNFGRLSVVKPLLAPLME